MTDFKPGDVFVNHRIEGLAGKGGMGVVYRATQLPLDRVVALKVISPALADDEGFRARFVAESKAAASIEHPNVIPVYYAGEREGVLFIVMRYVDGPDLRALVRGGGALEPRRAAAIVAQVGSALDAAHTHGLVHRDVKPANILLGPDDHAYLTDFGLTKTAAGSGVTRTAGWVGTLGYVSPEQIRGDPVDPRSDVYALGCVLVHALTGHAPFQRESDEATMWAHLNAPPPTDAVPPEFAVVVARALAKDPSDRYASAGDLGRAAQAALAAAAKAPPPAGAVVAADPDPAPTAPTAPVARPEPVPPAADGEGETRPSPVAAPEPKPGPPRRAPVAVAEVQPEPVVARAPEPEPTATRRQEETRPTEIAPRRAGRLLDDPRAALAAAVLIVAVAVGSAFALTSGSEPETAEVGTTKVIPTVTDPKVGPPVPVGPRPNAITVAGGKVWALSGSANDLYLVDARTGDREGRIDIGEGGTSIASDGQSVWVAKSSRLNQTLLRFDARTERRVGPAIALPADGNAVAVAVGLSAVWLAVRSREPGYEGAERVVRVDPATGAMQSFEVDGGVQDIAVGEEAVWVSNRFRDSVVRVNPENGNQVEIPVGKDPQGIAVGERAVWVVDAGDDALSRINPVSRNVTPIKLDFQPSRVTVGAGSVWVTARAAGQLIRILPDRRRVRENVEVGRRPFAVFAQDDRPVWVSLLGEDAVKRVDFAP